MQTRSIVDMYNHSYGLYGDVWAAWAEGIINIAVTIAIAINFGLVGILFGKIISLFIIVVLWKPYYLFTCGFKEHISIYWKGISKYYLCLGLSVTFITGTTYVFDNFPKSSLFSLIIFSLTEVIPTIFLYRISLYFIGPGTPKLFNRIFQQITRTSKIK